MICNNEKGYILMSSGINPSGKVSNKTVRERWPILQDAMSSYKEPYKISCIGTITGPVKRKKI